MRDSVFFIVLLALLVPTVVAETFTIRSGSDDLEINESLGNVIDALDETKLLALKGVSIKTTKTTVDYKQYIRFKNSALVITAPEVVYGENAKGTFGDFLFLKEGNNVSDAIFEYEIDFGEGIVSDVKAGKLETLHKNQLVMLGEQFTFLDSSLDTAKTTLTLKLAAADQIVTLQEGQKQIYILGGKPYEIEAFSVTESATLKVNNRTIANIKEGESKDLDGKMLFAVSNIFQDTEGKDAVTVLLNATILTLKDTDYTDDNFIQGFSSNNRLFSEGWVKIKATATATEAKIIKMFYRMVAGGKSSGDVYIPKGGSARSFLKQPETLFSPLLDIQYKGLVEVEKTPIKINPATSKRYDFHFYNKEGKSYKMPLIYNDAAYRIGDESRTLYFIEATGNTNFLVEQGDYFVVTSANEKNGITNVIRYNSINTDTRQIEFEDLSTGKFTLSYTPPSSGNFSGEGSIVAGGKSYKFYIKNTTTGGNTSTLAVDLNGDGAIETDEVNIITKGGAVIDLGSTNSPSGDFTITLTTEASQFDEAASAETINIPIVKRAAGVGIGNITGIPVEEKGKKTEGGSKYGVYLSVLEQDTETLEIKYPISQVFAQVNIVLATKTIILPSCADNIQNQGETGVDCGGPCAACKIINLTENITENITEQPQNLSVCEGCDKEGTCYTIGTRLAEQYCASDGLIHFAKDAGKSCAYNYECKNNFCDEGVCKTTKEPLNTGLVVINIAVILAAIVFIILTFHMQRKKEQPL